MKVNHRLLAASVLLIVAGAVLLLQNCPRVPETRSTPTGQVSRPSVEEPPAMKANPPREDTGTVLAPRADPGERDTAIEDGRSVVKCRITTGDPLVGNGVLYVSTPVEELPDGVVGQSLEHKVRVVRDEILFRTDRLSGEGLLRIPGYSRQRLRWDTSEGGAACSPVFLDPVAVVVGRVEPVWGEVSVSGCGSYDKTDEDGNFYLEVEPELCEVVASRKDGAVTILGEPASVVPVPGTEIEITLHLPEARGGGLGLRWEPVDEGWRVTGAFKNSPAMEAGVKFGDIISSVDGEPTGADSVAEIPTLTEGLEGSIATLTIISGGQERQIAVERRYLDDPWEFWYHCEPGATDCESGFVVKDGMEWEF
jgi:hypothetical protein